MDNTSLKHSLFFALLGALFFIPFLGGVHLFDWDEINFAEISREMLLTGDYTRVYVDFAPFYQKPPFFFWTQVLAMKAFGVGEFASRLPNAISGIATLVLLYHLGKHLYDRRFGIVWAGAYFGTVLPFLYSKSGIIDPFFNFFIFLGLYFFILFYWKKDGFDQVRLKKKKIIYLFWGGFFIGMGILTKGQVAYLIACLTFFVYWIYQRFRFYVSVPQFLFFTLAASIVTLSWYGLETLNHGPEFIIEFNKYQYELFSTHSAGHKGFPGYHFAVLLIGCFPASIFALRTFFKMDPEEYAYQQDFQKWMKYLFWVVLILFSIVQSKIVHYSSMCYYPLTFLAALCIHKIMNDQIKFNKWMKWGLGSIGSLYILATLVLPFAGNRVHLIKPLFKDPFAQANLEANITWTGWESLAGIVLLIVLLLSIRFINKKIFKKGFVILFGGTAIFVMVTLIFFINRIEGYSQRAAIEFFKDLKTEDCYVLTHNYKSYARLFYPEKRPITNPKNYDKDWLLNGDIDKDLYLVAKIHKAHELKVYDDLVEIGRKNGFVFLKRPKVK